MPKNTPAEIVAEGFHATQFGLTEAELVASVTALLGEVTEIVRSRVGTNYDATTEPVNTRVAQAEKFLCCARLCQRRINRVDADTNIGGDGNAAASLLKALRDNKAQYEADAERAFAAVPAATSVSESTSSAPAFGAVLTSHFNA